MKINRLIVALIAAALVVAVSPRASATTYDLNASMTVEVDTIYGKSWFTTQFTKTTGTGTLDPFLSIQGSPTEQGFNIDQGDLDTKRNGQYTRTQRVSDLQTIMAGGVQYYSFLLDINEPNNANSLISLDSLKIYTSSGSQPILTSLGALASSGTLRFDLDATTGGAGDTTLLYDDLNSGSGQGDIAFFIPVSAFLGVSSNDYFYLYQQFGNASPSFTSESGFEETRHGGDLTFVPVSETNAVIPLLAVLGVVVAGPFVRRCLHW